MCTSLGRDGGVNGSTGARLTAHDPRQITSRHRHERGESGMKRDVEMNSCTCTAACLAAGLFFSRLSVQKTDKYTHHVREREKNDRMHTRRQRIAENVLSETTCHLTESIDADDSFTTPSDPLFFFSAKALNPLLSLSSTPGCTRLPVRLLS